MKAFDKRLGVLSFASLTRTNNISDMLSKLFLKYTNIADANDHMKIYTDNIQTNP